MADEPHQRRDLLAILRDLEDAIDRETSAALRRTGITFPMGLALKAIRSGHPRAPDDLAGQIGRSGSAASSILAALSRRGMAMIAHGDGIRCIHLTPAGIKAAEVFEAAEADAVRKLFGGLSADELVTLKGVLGGMLANLGLGDHAGSGISSPQLPR